MKILIQTSFLLEGLSHLQFDDEETIANETSMEKTIENLKMKVKEQNFDISVLKRLIYMYVITTMY